VKHKKETEKKKTCHCIGGKSIHTAKSLGAKTHKTPKIDTPATLQQTW